MKVTRSYLVTTYGGESVKISVASDGVRLDDRLPDVLAECERRGIAPEAWCKLSTVSRSGVVAPWTTVYLGSKEPGANPWGHYL